jgi:hypothetical protein
MFQPRQGRRIRSGVPAGTRSFLAVSRWLRPAGLPPANLPHPSGMLVAPFDFAYTFSAIFIGRKMEAGLLLMKCNRFCGERNGRPAHLKMEFK